MSDLTAEKLWVAIRPHRLPRVGPLVGLADWAKQMFEEHAKAGRYLIVRRESIVKTESQP